MANSLKLPVGIDSFEKIRKNGFYYMDKTKLIEQLVETGGEVTLFTRPRRFGKTCGTYARKFIGYVPLLLLAGTYARKLIGYVPFLLLTRTYT